VRNLTISEISALSGTRDRVRPNIHQPSAETELLTIPTDGELLNRAEQGDETAFATLYRRRQGGIYRFALQMSGSAEIAEDVTQEVFITLARGAAQYDPARGSVAAWLYGVARNLVLRALHRRGDCVALDDENANEPVADESCPLDSLLQNEAVEAVRRAVLSLPAQYREAVILCDLQEMNYADAAEALGCPVGTVRSRLNRARTLLAGKLSAAKRCCV
jgi:RNA polymerase sigma-70 factor, ECF subfamily